MSSKRRRKPNHAKRVRERQSAKTAKVQRGRATRRAGSWVLCLVTIELDDAAVESYHSYIDSLEPAAVVATGGIRDALSDEVFEKGLRHAGNIPESVPISKVLVGEVHLPDGRKSVTWMFEMPNSEPGTLATLEDVHRRFVETNPDAPVMTCSSPVRDSDDPLYWYLNASHMPHALTERFDANAPGELAHIVGSRLNNVSGDADLPFELLGPP